MPETHGYEVCNEVVVIVVMLKIEDRESVSRP